MTLSHLIDVLMENSQSGGKFEALAQHLLKVFIMRLIWGLTIKSHSQIANFPVRNVSLY